MVSSKFPRPGFGHRPLLQNRPPTLHHALCAAYLRPRHSTPETSDNRSTSTTINNLTTRTTPPQMATDLIMPQLPDQQHAVYFQQSQHQQPPPQWQQQPVLPIFAPPSAHQRSQSSSTQISPLSTSGSPNSPKAYHTRQIRPLYMPAVLRPTEFPSKPLPTRTPRSENEDEEEDRTLKSNSSFISLGSAFGRLSRRSTGDSGKCVDGNWNLDMFPKPTGPPTRDHWKVRRRPPKNQNPPNLSHQDHPTWRF